jgi:integrase
MPNEGPDLYRINEVVERARARLRGPESNLSPQVARSILEFVAEREATVGPHQVSKYLSRLPDAARRLGKGFFHPDKKTKLAFLEAYRGSEGWTIKTVGSCLEAYWKWLHARRGQQFPEWLHLRIPRSRLNRKTDEDVLTRDEVGKLADSTDSLRDKALIWALYETGGRIGELMSLRLSDVEIQPEGYIRLRVRREKNGQLSPMFLFEAGVPSMVAWTQAHPSRATPNSALWVDTNKEWRSAIGYRAVIKMLQVAAHRSGVTKPVNPHNFRHTRATELAKDPTISAAMLEKAMGWVPGSRMAETYQHLAAKDLEDALRRAHGITGPAEARQLSRAQRPKTCGRCGTFNDVDNRFCGRCGGPLDVEAVLETETLKGKVTALAKLLEVPEVQQFLARTAAQKGILRN